MSSLVRSLLGLFVGAAVVDAHAVLKFPAPRSSAQAPSYNTGTGEKIAGVPFADANVYSCGGVSEPAPAAATPAGANIFSIANTAQPFSLDVTWTTTIAHTNPPGVFVKLIRSPTADWRNALVLLSAADSGPNGDHTATVQVPAGVNCTNCVLQWMWQSTADGGMYIGCADIALNAVGGGTTSAPSGSTTIVPTLPPTSKPTTTGAAASSYGSSSVIEKTMGVLALMLMALMKKMLPSA